MPTLFGQRSLISVAINTNNTHSMAETFVGAIAFRKPEALHSADRPRKRLRSPILIWTFAQLFPDRRRRTVGSGAPIRAAFLLF